MQLNTEGLHPTPNSCHSVLEVGNLNFKNEINFNIWFIFTFKNLNVPFLILSLYTLKPKYTVYAFSLEGSFVIQS